MNVLIPYRMQEFVRKEPEFRSVPFNLLPTVAKSLNNVWAEKKHSIMPICLDASLEPVLGIMNIIFRLRLTRPFRYNKSFKNQECKKLMRRYLWCFVSIILNCPFQTKTLLTWMASLLFSTTKNDILQNKTSRSSSFI